MIRYRYFRYNEHISRPRGNNNTCIKAPLKMLFRSSSCTFYPFFIPLLLCMWVYITIYEHRVFLECKIWIGPSQNRPRKMSHQLIQIVSNIAIIGTRLINILHTWQHYWSLYNIFHPWGTERAIQAIKEGPWRYLFYLVECSEWKKTAFPCC